MTSLICLAVALLLGVSVASGATIPAVEKALAPFIESREIAGAVTAVVAPDRILHLESHGLADVTQKRPMTDDAVFWIASMTKPITGVAVLMLQEEGKLSIDDPAAKYLPELGRMKMSDGSAAATITIKHLLTHTSGLPENAPDETRAAGDLAQLVTAFAGKRLSE